MTAGTNLGTITISTTLNLVKLDDGRFAAITNSGEVEASGSTIELLVWACENRYTEEKNDVTFGSPVRLSMQLEIDRVLSATE
jgi:hypothetical protein